MDGAGDWEHAVRIQLRQSAVTGAPGRFRFYDAHKGTPPALLSAGDTHTDTREIQLNSRLPGITHPT